MLTAEVADRLDALERRADAAAVDAAELHARVDVLVVRCAGLERSIGDALSELSALRQEVARLCGWRLAVEGELTRLTKIVAMLAAAHDDSPEVRAARAAAARQPLNEPCGRKKT